MIAPGPHAVAPARLQREGRVVECQGETVVRFLSECSLSGGVCPGHCGVSTRARQIPLVWFDAIPEVLEGERVTLEVHAGALTQVAAMVFAVPLVALVGGAWLGGQSAGTLGLAHDIASGAAGLACLALSSTLMARYGAAMAGMLRLTARRQRTD